MEINYAIRWIEIYPMHSAIQRLNNQGQIYNHSIIPSTDAIQLTLTVKMTTSQFVETSVTVNNNSPIQEIQGIFGYF